MVLHGRNFTIISSQKINPNCLAKSPKQLRELSIILGKWNEALIFSCGALLTVCSVNIRCPLQYQYLVLNKPRSKRLFMLLVNCNKNQTFFLSQST